MTRKELNKIWDKYLAEDEHGEFDRVPESQRLSARQDLCALILLDKLVPGTDWILTWAAWDEVGLSVGLEKLCLVATEDDILTLIRCGVRRADGSLCLFV